jgi:hypothetical protein
MDLTGYRAFLLGTAQDRLPVRGIWFTVQRREDVEGAASQRAFMGAANPEGRLSESNGTETA